jgi:endonuclease YncB( thermonuclease family)
MNTLAIKKLFTLVLSLLFCGVLHSQDVSVKKILDNNLYLLSSGQAIRIRGISIPPITTTSTGFSEICFEAKKYASRILLDGSILIQHLSTDTSLTVFPVARITRVYLNENVDIGVRMLENGYAVVDTTTLLPEFSSKYSISESKARESKEGLWLYLPKNTNADSIAKEWRMQADLADISYLQNKNNPPATLQSEDFNEYEWRVTPGITLSIVAVLLGWDYLSEASDANDAIDAYDKIIDIYKSLHLSTTAIEEGKQSLESTRNRKTFIGISCLVAGVVNTIFSFERVKVSSINDRLSLSYSFQ